MKRQFGSSEIVPASGKAVSGNPQDNARRGEHERLSSKKSEEHERRQFENSRQNDRVVGQIEKARPAPRLVKFRNELAVSLQPLRVLLSWPFLSCPFS